MRDSFSFKPAIEQAPKPESIHEILFNRTILPYVEKIDENPALNRIEQGHLSPEQWKQFVVERIHATEKFIPLLIQAIAKSAEELPENPKLQEVLQENLGDEDGSNDPEAGPHDQWRKDWVAAMGIDEKELEEEPQLQSSKNYQATVEQLITQGSALQLVGAITLLERIIPPQFHKILRGCEIDYPDQFLLSDSDSPENTERKNKNRRYLWDHIIHDMKRHYKDLEEALTPLVTSEESLVGLRQGMSQLWPAIEQFLQEVEEKILAPDLNEVS